MCSLRRLCIWQYLFVCLLDKSTSYRLILMKFSGKVGKGLWDNRFDLGGDPDPHLGPRFVFYELCRIRDIFFIYNILPLFARILSPVVLL